MNFDLEPELNQLDESLGRLLANIYSFDQRRAMVAGTSNPNPEVWDQLTKLGVTALGLPAELGGYEGGPIA
ncbi:MAG: acyl-CoA dehydrogenase, partial [Pigmentiphaga sp.]